MMEGLSPLLNGFALALTPQNLLFCLLGALLGTLVGVLPGIGPTSGIAILLPLTSVLPPTPAIIMLAGIYYGAMYGGSTTAILINTPGEVSSVTTALDGYQLARQGRPGPALAIAAVSSFVAGTLSLIGLTFFAPRLADLALEFGPPEFFGLMVLALSIVASLSGKSLARGVVAGALGLLFAMVGLDPTSGSARLTFGSYDLLAGINFISVVVGLFAIAEILVNTEEYGVSVYKTAVSGLMPTLKDLKDSAAAMIRSTVIGFFLGLLPGCTPGVVAFLAYDAEKRFSKHPERFGTGVIEGVAAPEGANNAVTSSGFIPLLALGVPASPPLAILLGGFMIYGLQPGPMLFQRHPDFAWAVIASMYLGNVMLLILNLPLVGLWAKLVQVPYPILAPLVLVFSFIGAFSVRNSMFDVGAAIFFGALGYGMRKLDYPAAPLVLCLILQPMLENSLQQSLGFSRGDFSVFLSRPVAATLLVAAVALTGMSLYARLSQPRAGDLLSAGAAEQN